MILRNCWISTRDKAEIAMTDPVLAINDLQVAASGVRGALEEFVARFIERLRTHPLGASIDASIATGETDVDGTSREGCRHWIGSLSESLSCLGPSRSFQR